MATAPTTTKTKRRAAKPARGPGRRIRVTVQKVGPWSVLKFSLIFNFCLMLIVLVGLGILYAVLDALGFIGGVEGVLQFLFPPEDPNQPYRLDGVGIFRTMFLIGLISTAVWSLLLVFIAFLYNLISDLVGGLDVTLAERKD